MSDKREVNDQYYSLIKERRALIKEYVDRIGSLMGCSCVDNEALNKCDMQLCEVSDKLLVCYSDLYKNANTVLMKKLGL